ncbi:MAG TPA: lysophospholipid acyltransferase family protein [Polyangiaceae bacterium]|jgi:KDO2-lipid IV(A) lauroyltransferase
MLVRLLGALLGWLAGSVLRIRRGHVEASMRAAGIAGVPAEARAMYASLGASAVEFLWMALRGPTALGRVRFDDASRARWEGALGQGRGVVVAASHTGNWDLAACAVAREVELLVVTKHLRVRWLDRFWQSTRARLGVRLSDADGAIARSRAVLRRGGVVAMMIDQVPLAPSHASPVPFLGRTAATDRAPAALAASARVPLVVAAFRRDEAGAQVLQVLDVVPVPARPSRAWVLETTRSATAALDAFVRAHPSQWLWLHRRWKPMLARTSPCRPPIRSSSPAAASPAASS